MESARLARCSPPQPENPSFFNVSPQPLSHHLGAFTLPGVTGAHGANQPTRLRPPGKLFSLGWLAAKVDAAIVGVVKSGTHLASWPAASTRTTARIVPGELMRAQGLRCRTAATNLLGWTTQAEHAVNRQLQVQDVD
jgi:hypothetical protein